MRLAWLRARNFQCFGPAPTKITFEPTSFLIGPNGSGKTALLQALSRMFGSPPSTRSVRLSDFHVPLGEAPGIGTARDLWLEAEFEFPELLDDGTHPTVPPHFAHMRLTHGDEGAVPVVRFRLTAELDADGEIAETFEYVLAVDGEDEPTQRERVNSFARRDIAVHYLPARRNPADHVSYAANSLIGRLLRAANWLPEREDIAGLSGQISAALSANAAVSQLAGQLTGKWGSLHSGSYFTEPGVAFLQNDIEGLLRHVTITFTPGPGESQVDFSALSDGQQSLLYVSLVLTMHAIGRATLAGDSDVFDVDRLRPPVFTLLAVEEPENSLSPHYLGRVLKALTEFADAGDAQVVLATHSPALMRRVAPEDVRYLRLDGERHTTVAQVQLPAASDEAYKFVREALHAYPELYFARLVILGEGDSEEVVLPRCLDALGLGTDATGISIAPLGGRHVNHFWRLLHGLGIPHVTLLDLDMARHGGGWGRIKYAATQLLKFPPPALTMKQEHIDAIPAWNSAEDVRGELAQKWLAYLETCGVFFSSPLDLDLMLLAAYRAAYGVAEDELEDPPPERITSVLGKSHGDIREYTNEERRLFGAYHSRFMVGSKPVHHVDAMSALDDAALNAAMPAALRRLADHVRATLNGLPE